MDPTVLNNFINSVREVLLRSSGSKRLMAFFAWLLCVTLGTLSFDELAFSAASLWFLWLLFKTDTKQDRQSDALVPVGGAS